MKLRTSTPLIALLSMAPCFLHAQSYSVKWSAFSAGGGNSGAHTLRGTAQLGDPLAGSSKGGVYTLTTGYGSVVGIQPVAGAPALSIARGNGVVMIAWPRTAAGWVLDQARSLNGGAATWTEVAGPYRADSTHVYVTFPLSIENTYFRLRKPDRP